MNKSNISQHRDVLKNPDVLLDLHNQWTWALPQLSTWFAQSVPLVRSEQGLVSPSNSLIAIKDYLDRGSLILGSTVVSISLWRDLWNTLITSPRGEVLQGGVQSRAPGIRWNAGVPIILSFFKEHRGLNYDLWDWTDPHMSSWIDPDLYKALTTPIPRLWTKEDLLSFRDQGLVVKSGVKQGTSRDPKTAPNLTGVEDQQFNRLPRLLKLMLCQCWCYHPSTRHQYMVLDPHHKDHTPEPLVVDQVLGSSRVEQETWQW